MLLFPDKVEQVSSKRIQRKYGQKTAMHYKNNE